MASQLLGRTVWAHERQQAVGATRQETPVWESANLLQLEVADLPQSFSGQSSCFSFSFSWSLQSRILWDAGCGCGCGCGALISDQITLPFCLLAQPLGIYPWLKILWTNC